MLPRNQARCSLPALRQSVKGYAQSAPFAMGKFALRGLAQSMARAGTRASTSAHFVIDGGIRNARPHRAGGPAGLACSTPTPSRRPTCDVLRQPRSAWTWEIELRPWVETF